MRVILLRLFVLFFLIVPVCAWASSSQDTQEGVKEKSFWEAAFSIGHSPVKELLAAGLVQKKLDTKAVFQIDLGALYFRDVDGLRAFYQLRDFKPLWIDGEEIKSQAIDVVGLLEQSWVHGLNPENYHVGVLKRLLKAGDERAAVLFELALSDAVIRYGKDMTGMRVSPVKIGADPHSWQRGAATADVLNYIADHDNPSVAMKKFDPPGKLYSLMQEELKILLQEIDEQKSAPVQRIDFSKTLYPDDTHANVSLLRARLKVSGEGHVYAGPLVDAVKRFQDKNGLKPDGIIGRRTIAALNKTQQDRFIQLIANMERIRWLSPELPHKYIVVNIPAMTLWAIEDARIVHEMPVIVGRIKRPTNSFIADITGVRFNPSWTVPETIKAKDFLPALREDPRALEKKGIFIVHGKGAEAREISPDSVDWSQVSEADLKQVRMIQPPGDKNALGQIRVLMPNDYNIYLHDTNTPELFVRDDRAQSSGCVRMAEPEKIAEFILQANAGWQDGKLQSYLDKAKTSEVRAETQIPVYILYQTVWLHKEGGLVFGDDLYGEDLKLFESLDKVNAVFMPSLISNHKNPQKNT